MTSVLGQRRPKIWPRSSRSLPQWHSQRAGSVMRPRDSWLFECVKVRLGIGLHFMDGFRFQTKPTTRALCKLVHQCGFFIFLFFIFVFYKNIFSIWKFIGIYPGRLAAGRQGLLCKSFCSNICT